MTTRYARGTDRYRAPELVTLISGEKPEFTNKVDLWAFGCIIFELVCSKPAFRGGDYQVLMFAKHPTEYPLDLKIAAENVPDDKKREWFSTAIQELLQLEPARRPSAKDIGLRIIQLEPARRPTAKDLGLRIIQDRQHDRAGAPRRSRFLPPFRGLASLIVPNLPAMFSSKEPANFPVKDLATKPYRVSFRPTDYIVVNALNTHMATCSQRGGNRFLQELWELGTGKVLWELETDQILEGYPCFSPDGHFAGFRSDLSIVVIKLGKHLRISSINLPPKISHFQYFALSPSAARVCLVIIEPHGRYSSELLAHGLDTDFLYVKGPTLFFDLSLCYSTDGAHLFFMSSTMAGSYFFQCYEVSSGTPVTVPMTIDQPFGNPLAYSQTRLETIQLNYEDWLVSDFIHLDTGTSPWRKVMAISRAGTQKTMLHLIPDYRGDVIVSQGKVMAFSKDGEIVTSDGERSLFKPLKPRGQDGRVLTFTEADEIVFLTSTGDVHRLLCEPFVKATVVFPHML